MLDRPVGTPVARIENLRVEFQTRDGPVTGVEDVSFEVFPGETVCVVGESGSGKSVSSLSLMRLVEFGGGEIAGGRLIFDEGKGHEIDLAKTPQNLMRTIRGNQIGMIFQEPMTALNPLMTIGKQIDEGFAATKEALAVFGLVSGKGFGEEPHTRPFQKARFAPRKREPSHIYLHSLGIPMPPKYLDWDPSMPRARPTLLAVPLGRRMIGTRGSENIRVVTARSVPSPPTTTTIPFACGMIRSRSSSH